MAMDLDDDALRAIGEESAPPLTEEARATRAVLARIDAESR